MSFRIHPGAPLDAEIRRIAARQIDRALTELSSPDENGDFHEAIHDARKRFKKLRALLRLVRSGDPAFARLWNGRLRDTARTLSSVRDRTALIESLDALEAHVPTTLAAKSIRPAFAAVRKGLEAKRRAAIAAEADLPATIAAAEATLTEARAALEALAFRRPVKDAAAILAKGYAATHARARDALKRAARTAAASREAPTSPEASEELHELRRHMKYLGFHLAILSAVWPEAFAPMRDAASAVADDLGRDHDYALLSAELASGEGAETMPDPLAAPHHAALVAALIASRQAELQASSLLAARRLLAEKPKAAQARIARLYRDAAAAATPAPDPSPAAIE